MTITPSAKNQKGNTETIKDAKVILVVSSIKSEKGETMDNKMYQALKEKSHQKIVFVLTQPIKIMKAPAKLSATGNIELAGITRPLTFDLDLTHEENGYHFQGSRTLRMSDFQIDPPSAMFGQIVAGDEIVVELNLFFTPN